MDRNVIINNYSKGDFSEFLEYDSIQKEYLNPGIFLVYNYLKELSDREIFNYIIDYNFEENYYNIMLDMRELLRFYYDANNCVSIMMMPEEIIGLSGNCYSELLILEHGRIQTDMDEICEKDKFEVRR